MLPEPGQRVFEGEQGGLGEGRAGQIGLAALEDQRAQVGTGRRAGMAGRGFVADGIAGGPGFLDAGVGRSAQQTVRNQVVQPGPAVLGGLRQRADGFGHLVEGAGKDRFLFVQLPSHAGVLGALAGEQPDERPLAGCLRLGMVGTGRFFQCGDGFGNGPGQHHLTVCQRAAAMGQREADVWQQGVGRTHDSVIRALRVAAPICCMACACCIAGPFRRLAWSRSARGIRPGDQLPQVSGQLAALGGQGGGRGRAQRQCMRYRRHRGVVAGRQRPRGQIGRGFFQNDVCVGAAHTEGADGGTARGTGRDRPWRVFGRDAERAALQLQAGVGAAIVQGARNELVLQGHQGLDGGRGAGGNDGVADVALERAQRGKTGVGCFLAPGAGQRPDLHRITHGRGGTVRLHILDAAGRHPGIGQGGADHGMLAVQAHRREAGLVAAIVVDGHAPDHPVDGIAVAAGIGQALEQHHGRAIGEHGALGIRIEAAGTAVGREHRTGLVPVAAVDRCRHGHTAGQRHLALARPQGQHGLGNGHQRGGAGGVHRNGRSLQVQPVGRTGGDVVLLVVEHHLELAEAGDLFRVMLQVALEIGRVVHAGEHADAAVAVTRCMAAVLQTLPGQFEEDALLRVHQLGLARTDAEEGGIEASGIVQDTAGRYVVRVAGQAGRQ